jgi:DNA repair photolyase
MARRLLLTIDQTPCPFGCTYCFAAFHGYERPKTMREVCENPSLLDSVDVVYPACDVDLFARSDALKILSQAIRWKRSISISTIEFRKSNVRKTPIHAA